MIAEFLLFNSIMGSDRKTKGSKFIPMPPEKLRPKNFNMTLQIPQPEKKKWWLKPLLFLAGLIIKNQKGIKETDNVKIIDEIVKDSE